MFRVAKEVTNFLTRWKEIKQMLTIIKIIQFLRSPIKQGRVLKTLWKSAIWFTIFCMKHPWIPGHNKWWTGITLNWREAELKLRWFEVQWSQYLFTPAFYINNLINMLNDLKIWSYILFKGNWFKVEIRIASAYHLVVIGILVN